MKEVRTLADEGRYPYRFKNNKLRSSADKLLSPEEISAAILKDAMKNATLDTPTATIKAEITVPT